MEDKATLIRQVFGDSSDDDDHQNYELNSRSEPESSPVAGESADAGLFRNPGWERVKEIRGLWICRDFLTHVQQLSLLSAIQNEGWFLQESHNQAMRFGDLPGWVNGLSYSIREALLSGDNLSEPSFTSEEETLFPILPLELLGREPLFDQLIVNLYHPGQGICAHVDLMRFDDGIAIVSLESPCVMHFISASSNGTQEEEDEENYEHPVGSKVPVYLNPGSLVIMAGEARYCWKHEINRKPGFQVWDGREIEQKRRISITLRKLVQAK